MCLVCKDYELSKLTEKEAIKNLSEIYDPLDDHHHDLWVKLFDNMVKKLKEERKLKGK